ncbi:MAG: response regulator [Pseudomonadota bacterium]|nr:response regulator [Pseudomonadota bacterium]
MMSCLIVDDSKVVRTLARRMVEPMGFTVQEAENGEAALVCCRSAMPDCILLDWHMPVMDGLQFLKQLRVMDSGSRPKVIFCTTETELQHIQEALASGADEYVMKPFDAGILKDKLIQTGILNG